MKKPIIILIFCCVMTSVLNAQKLQADSQSNLINDKKESTVRFYGHLSAKLFSREVEESVKGVIKNSLISTETTDFPKGFVRTSLPGRPWNTTSWTRDSGTLLRELTHWGYLEPAVLISEYLLDHVRLNPEGYYIFPEYFAGKGAGATGWGNEMDGTAYIMIGMVRLWQRLSATHELKGRLYRFLTGPDSPTAYIVKELDEEPLIASSEEFGGGWGIKGDWYNVVTNGLVRQALLTVAEVEQESGNQGKAKQLRDKAAAHLGNIRKHLINPADGSWIWCINPVTLTTDSTVLNHRQVKGTASINGASACYADGEGLEPLAADWPGVKAAVTTLENVYNKYPFRKEQFEKYGMCTFVDFHKEGYAPSYASWLSYCDCYAAQTMLLTDQTEQLDKVMNWIAASTYAGGRASAAFIREVADGTAQIDFNATDSVFWFIEQNFSPEFKWEMGKGCGKLNLVNVSEPLKLARMMTGIDNRYSDVLTIVPRLPRSWRGVEVRNWLVTTTRGVIRMDMDFEEGTDGKYVLTLDVKDGKSIPKLMVRFPDGTRKEYTSISGTLKLKP